MARPLIRQVNVSPAVEPGQHVLGNSHERLELSVRPVGKQRVSGVRALFGQSARTRPSGRGQGDQDGPLIGGVGGAAHQVGAGAPSARPGRPGGPGSDAAGERPRRVVAAARGERRCGHGAPGDVFAPGRVAALAELRRVLRPDGVVRFLEHTRADTAGLALVQRIADATLWPWFTGGCHTARDPLAALRDAGFTVTRVRRLRFPAGRAAV
jgi:hypothetical protein